MTSIHFFVPNFYTIESFNNLYISWCSIFIIFILICSVFLLFFLVEYYFFNISWIHIRHRFWFRSFNSNFISNEFSCCFRYLWATFLVTVYKASTPVFVATSINCFPFLLDRFLTNDKKIYPFTYFLVLGYIE